MNRGRRGKAVDGRGRDASRAQGDGVSMSFILDRMTIPRRLLADQEADRVMTHLRSLSESGATAPDRAARVDHAGQRYAALSQARDEAQRILELPIDEETTAQIIAVRDRLEGLHAAWVAACRGLTGAESAEPEPQLSR